jgi:hypothetical protein
VALFDCHLERRKEDIAECPLAEWGRADVRAGLRLAVPGHVLEGGDHVVGRDFLFAPLEAPNRGQAYPRHQVRVLAVRLLEPPPARVAGHVDHRGEHLLGAA